MRIRDRLGRLGGGSDEPRTDSVTSTTPEDRPDEDSGPSSSRYGGYSGDSRTKEELGDSGDGGDDSSSTDSPTSTTPEDRPGEEPGPSPRDSGGSSGRNTPSQGVEAGSGSVSDQARRLEQQVLESNPNLRSDDVAIQRDGDTLRAELTESGVERREQQQRNAYQSIVPDSLPDNRVLNSRRAEVRDVAEGVGVSFATSSGKDREEDGLRRVRQADDEFVDYDWSFGFGDPDVDEVENAVRDFSSRAGDVVDLALQTQPTLPGRSDLADQVEVGGGRTVTGAPVGALEFGEDAWFVLENKQNPAYDTPEQSLEKTQNTTAFVDNKVSEGQRAAEYYQDNPGDLPELAGQVFTGAVLGTGAVGAARRASDIPLPDRPGSFIDDTRGQADWGSKTIEVEKTVSRQADDVSGRSASDAARERLPDPGEYESIDAYEREWARATARERFREQGVSTNELPEWEVEAMEQRVFDEWGLDALDDTTATTRTTSATTTGTRSVGAAAAGGGLLGGLGAEATVDPDADTSRTFAPPAFDGTGTAAESSVFGDSTGTDVFPVGDTFGDTFGTPTTTVTIGDDLTTPATTTTTTTTQPTPTTTDAPPVPDFDTPRSPEFDRSPVDDEEEQFLRRYDAWEKEWESGILSADEVWSREFGDGF